MVLLATSYAICPLVSSVKYRKLRQEDNREIEGILENTVTNSVKCQAILPEDPTRPAKVHKTSTKYWGTESDWGRHHLPYKSVHEQHDFEDAVKVKLRFILFTGELVRLFCSLRCQKWSRFNLHLQVHYLRKRVFCWVPTCLRFLRLTELQFQRKRHLSCENSHPRACIFWVTFCAKKKNKSVIFVLCTVCTV